MAIIFLSLIVSFGISLLYTKNAEQTMFVPVVLGWLLVAVLTINYRFSAFVKLLFFWLPFQNFAGMILYKITGDHYFVMGMLVGKELFLLVGFVYIFLKRKTIGLIYLDYLSLLFCAYLFLYAVIPNGVLGINSSPTARIVGLRASIIPFLLYFFGRLSGMSMQDLKHIIYLYVGLAVAVCLFGFIEYILPVEFWIDLGYFDFKAATEEVTGIPEGADSSMLAKIFLYGHFGGNLVRRMISTFGSSLHVAFYLLLPILLMIIGIIYRRQIMVRANGISMDKMIFIVLLFGFIITVSRGPIIALTASIMYLILFILKGKRRLKLILTAGMFVGLFALFFTDNIKQIVMTTVSFEDASAIGHYMAYEYALQVIPEHPFGLGLGQGGPVGRTYGIGEGVGESLYFTLTGEIGIPGLLLFLVIIISIFMYLRKYGKQLDEHNDIFLRVMSIALAASTIAYSIGSLNTEQWRGYTMSGPYWFLLGVTISLIEAKKMTEHGRRK